MEVRIQYFTGCPHWSTALERVMDALARTGQQTAVVVERIDSHEDAAATGFHGSPTVLVDGNDPFGRAGGGVGLSCRRYETEDGTEGSPSPEQLETALTSTT